MSSTAVSRVERDREDKKRSQAAIVAVAGLALLLAVAYVWAAWQTEPAPVEVPAAPARSTTVPPEPEPEPSAVRIERDATTVRLSGTVKTESERDALSAAVTNSGLEVDDQLTVSPNIADSDPRVVAALLAPLLDGTDDGELALNDGTVTITGEALDPVEAEEIQSAIDTATAAGLTLEDQTTIRVLPESVQIMELQKEIDQIFELAREIEGQYPNFAVSVEDLSSGAKTTLDRVAVAFRRYPLPVADVIGHTDSTGPNALNQALSEARAQTVTEYLVGVGVESERLTAIGRGESEPLADNSTELGRAENRRVDFVVKKREG
ncbi:MAG: OmpA family protein [Acidimicrobiia bacterium]|nr:OmpA family protein [Acidimicrobiia bacterium]